MRISRLPSFISMLLLYDLLFCLRLRVREYVNIFSIYMWHVVSWCPLNATITLCLTGHLCYRFNIRYLQQHL